MISALAVLCIAGAVVAVVLLTGGSSRSKSAGNTVGAGGVQPPAATTFASTAPAFTEDDMRSVLLSYVTAFSHENLNSLRSLFADDLVRQNGTDPPQGLDDALSTYAEQFAALSNPDYTLSNITYSLPDSSASGFYSIVSDNAPKSTGGISFHFVTRDGQLLIDQIAIAPD